MLSHLKVIDNPHDEISWMRIFSIVPGLGESSGQKIFQYISKFKNPTVKILENDFFAVQMKGSRIPNAGKQNLIDHVKYFVDYGPLDSPAEVISDIVSLIKNHVKSNYKDWENRIEDLNQLSIYAQNYPTIRKFLENLSLNLSSVESRVVRAGDNNLEERPLVLSTIHRAKGLEWRVVFMPMLCDDYFPSSKVLGDDEAFEEERRVFYVALTRAKDQLYLISPSVVQSFKGIQAATVSTFLSELDSSTYKKATVNFLANDNMDHMILGENEENSQFMSAYSLLNQEENSNLDKNNTSNIKKRYQEKRKRKTLSDFLND